MNKRVWVIQDREAGNVIDKASSYKEVCEMLRLYEKADKVAGVYQEDFYEIVCKIENTEASNITCDEYQQGAMTTADGIPDDLLIIYPTLGLAGEAGEVVEKIKKVLRNDNGKFTKEKRAEIAKELGDVLWYIAVLANNIGYKLSEIAEMNHAKLKDRKERGVIKSEGDNR